MTINVRRELYGAESLYVNGEPLLETLAPHTSIMADFENSNRAVHTAWESVLYGRRGPRYER